MPGNGHGEDVYIVALSAGVNIVAPSAHSVPSEPKSWGSLRLDRKIVGSSASPKEVAIRFR